LEKNRLVAWPWGVAKSANGLGGFVLVGREQVVEALVSYRRHEPFTFVGQMSVIYDGCRSINGLGLAYI
jgi:uncharacterized protein YhfF